MRYKGYKIFEEYYSSKNDANRLQLAEFFNPSNMENSLSRYSLPFSSEQAALDWLDKHWADHGSDIYILPVYSKDDRYKE